ncbi:MAG: alpha/beta hydrolase, partial [Myxococcaceae bacterium]|nr:alpha/beta hydrolase [Myxococcaceae bacterium]
MPRSEKPANPAPAAGVADEAKKPFQPGVRVSEPVERALADKVASTASLQAWEQSANVFTRGSERLAYWTAGEGKPLILVHGFPTASYDWHQVWPDLSKDRKLYAMDMLGFGFSDKPKSASYSTFAQADRLQDFIASKGQSEVDLLSHDFGDTVVQELLARQNEGKLPFKIR